MPGGQNYRVRIGDRLYLGTGMVRGPARKRKASCADSLDMMLVHISRDFGAVYGVYHRSHMLLPRINCPPAKPLCRLDSHEIQAAALSSSPRYRSADLFYRQSQRAQRPPDQHHPTPARLLTAAGVVQFGRPGLGVVPPAELHVRDCVERDQLHCLPHRLDPYLLSQRQHRSRVFVYAQTLVVRRFWEIPARCCMTVRPLRVKRGPWTEVTSFEQVCWVSKPSDRRLKMTTKRDRTNSFVWGNAVDDYDPRSRTDCLRCAARPV